MSRISLKVMMALVLCTSSMAFAVSKKTVIEFRGGLSSFISTALDLHKKKGFGSLTDKESALLVSKMTAYIDSCIPLIFELSMDNNNPLINVINDASKKIQHAVNTDNVKALKKASDDLIHHLDKVIASIK